MRFACVCMLLTTLTATGCNRPPDAALPSPDDPRYADAWIDREVSAGLERDRELRKFNIHVQSSGRVVFLQAAVPTEALRQRAERLAAGTPTVAAVRNNIVVIHAPLPAVRSP